MLKVLRVYLILWLLIVLTVLSFTFNIGSFKLFLFMLKLVAIYGYYVLYKVVKSTV